MSQQNVAIVRRAYELLHDAVDERAVSNLVEAGLLDPGFEVDLRPGTPGGRLWPLAEATRYFDTEPWGRSLSFQADSFQAIGTDCVLVSVRTRGVGGASGMAIEGRFAHLVTLRYNRIARTEVYSDLAEARGAAGLTP